MKKKPMTVHDPEGRRKYLSRDEGRRFRRAAEALSPPKSLFCLTIYFTGCRISEALNLRPADIDSELNIIRIHSLKKRGKREIRRVPVPESLVRGLLKLAGADPQQRLWKFCRTTGWRTIKRTMLAKSISGIHATTKGLRHGFGVRCALEQVPVNVIRDWMGHADSDTTAIYLAVRDEEERELMGRTWK